MTAQTGGRRCADLLRDALPWVPSGAAGVTWVAQRVFDAGTPLSDITEVMFPPVMTVMAAQLVCLGVRRVVREVKLGGTVTVKWGAQAPGHQADSSGP